MEHVAKTGKDVIMSTGMANYEDIENALEVFDAYNTNVAIMQCTSEYPTPMADVNLRVINTLREKYKKPVGLSDHTAGVLTAPLAVVLGAQLIEKHITLSRAMKGTDQPGSLEFPGMIKLVDYCTNALVALGSAEKTVPEAVKPFREKLERSLVARRAITAGEVLQETDLILKSPGTGILWKDRGMVVGKKAKNTIAENTLIDANDFE